MYYREKKNKNKFKSSIMVQKKFKIIFWKKLVGIPFSGTCFPQEYKVHFYGQSDMA